MFTLVWDLVPRFLKARIRDWAEADMEGPIAQEITEYVKLALGALPIPVPAILINAAANLIVPPLARLIINELANLEAGGVWFLSFDADGKHAYHSLTPARKDASLLQWGFPPLARHAGQHGILVRYHPHRLLSQPAY